MYRPLFVNLAAGYHTVYSYCIYHRQFSLAIIWFGIRCKYPAGIIYCGFAFLESCYNKWRLLFETWEVHQYSRVIKVLSTMYMYRTVHYKRVCRLCFKINCEYLCVEPLDFLNRAPTPRPGRSIIVVSVYLWRFLCFLSFTEMLPMRWPCTSWPRWRSSWCRTLRDQTWSSSAEWVKRNIVHVWKRGRWPPFHLWAW